MLESIWRCVDSFNSIFKPFIKMDSFFLVILQKYVVGKFQYKANTILGECIIRFQKRMIEFGSIIFDKNQEIDYEKLIEIFERDV